MPGGEAEIAGKYLEWARQAANEGRRGAAINALRRALNYADVSSDISYLLASLEYEDEMIMRGQVLSNVNLAIGTDRWNYYSLNDARLLKANILVDLMRYDEALRIIALIDESEEKELLRLKALLHSKQNALFRRAAERAMELYPFSPGIAALTLQYAGTSGEHETAGEALLSTILRRLGALCEIDAGLIRQAAPFMPDIEEAARQLEAWIASSGTALPKPALPVLLNLGVIGEDVAIDALFAEDDTRTIVIDRGTLTTVFNLLRTEPSRERFISTITRYTGIIREDKNNDGIYESSCSYRSGHPVHYANDAKQERLSNIEMQWKAGEARYALITLVNDTDIISLADAPSFTRHEDIIVEYDIYPAVKKISVNDNIYYFRMEDFYYAPLLFKKLLFDDGMMFPELNSEEYIVTLRTLSSFAYIIEGPSREFQDAVEQIKLLDGIVVSSRETLDGKVVSETEFVSGKPFRQKIDLDLDGRMETLRFFKLNEIGESEIDSTQSDWDGDGIYEE
jgi:hypothetical protein